MRPLAVLTLVAIVAVTAITPGDPPGDPSVQPLERAGDPVAEAAAHVLREVTYVEHRRLADANLLPHGYLVAVSAMNYVVGRVTAPAYGYRREISRESLPDGPTADAMARRALSMQAGICGHAVHTMMSILSRLGVRSRQVQLHYSTPRMPANGHVGVEVDYGDAWHYLDPTWGSVYVHPGDPPAALLSAQAIALLPPKRRARARRDHDTLLWRQATATSPALPAEIGYAAFEAADLRVVIDDVVVYQRQSPPVAPSSGEGRPAAKRGVGADVARAGRPPANLVRAAARR